MTKIPNKNNVEEGKVYLRLMVLEVSVHRRPVHCAGPKVRKHIIGEVCGRGKLLPSWQQGSQGREAGSIIKTMHHFRVYPQ